MYIFTLVMPNCRLIASLFILIHCTMRLAGQSNYSRLETFGTRDGMLSSKIYALAQTTDRKLWIGTEIGVSVYDGYQFTNYQYTSDNESIGRVLCFTQDSSGAIWFGGDKGLFYCNDGAISRISITGNPLPAPEALLTDAAGNVWIGDMNALYRLTPELLKKIRNKKTGIELPNSTTFNQRVFGLAEDNKHNIYIASYNGVYIVSPGNSEARMVWQNSDPARPVRSVAAISPDSLFWNCRDMHPYQKLNGRIDSRFTEEYIGISVFVNRGKIFALTTSGVGLLKNGYAEPLALFGKATNNAVAALVDAEENIWIGSWEGLLKFRRTGFRQEYLPANAPKETFSFLERKNGEIIFGSNRGLIFTKKPAGIVIDKKIPPLFPLAEVMCLFEDPEEGLWSGSGYQGISRFKNNRISNWNNTGFLKDNNCEALYTAGDGKLYACTENGVTLIDPGSPEPMKAHYPFQQQYTRPPELFGGFQSGDSPCWFYGSRGLFKLQNNMLVNDAVEGMPVQNLYINRIICDRKGNTWIATQGKGLLKCSVQTGKLVLQKQYDSHNGLPSDIALSVLADKNDNIWLGDYMSVSLLMNPGMNEQLITYNEKDGLLSSYYQTLKLEKERNGTIWGLTSMGLFSFHPDSVIMNRLPPALLLNSVTAKGIDSNFASAPSIVLNYSNNTIAFQFTGVCLTEPSKTRYAYRIRELDAAWTYTTERSANFNPLRPGTYTFELKACNNSNVWTVQALQYTFTISPPFWQTWWFRIMTLAVIAVLLVLLFRRRVAVIKNKAAIRQQLTEMEGKALRAQMNPHFIFNSLNAIQELIVTRNVDEGYQYLSSFSKLLRLVLNNSEKNTIPLSSEMEMIRLQLSLESLRFKNSFRYHIETDDAVEPELIKIPPLLLQPYVENAVWHGLRHKEGDKNLWIRVKESSGRVYIEIEDNGVGRQKAGEIKNQKLGAGQFESKGTALSEQRINILNEQYPGTAQVDIQDLRSANNEPAGTKVKISLPANLK